MTVNTLIAHARRALAENDLAACARHASDAIGTDPTRAEPWFLMGMALAAGGKVATAIDALTRAAEQAPDEVDYHAHLARVLTLARRERAARNAADRAASLCATATALTIDTIGCVYARLGDHDRALSLFEQAVGRDPASVPFRFNLATSYGFFGKIEAAQAQYEAILALDPHFGRAWLGLAGLRRHTPSSHHIDEIERALTTHPPPVEALRMHYAAAKEYEDIGDFERSFNHLFTANCAHKHRQGFDLSHDRATFDAMMSAFADPDYFSGFSNIPDRPIFVTGMPRTGTTLVDTILSAHASVTSAGELQSMPLAIKRATTTGTRHVLDIPTIQAARSLDPHSIGLDYLARARQHNGGTNPVFVDKFPLNFLYIGFIARALPHASIICLRRNPMDTVWSNYKNLFATGSPYYGWSYDLLDTAEYYLMFDKIMAFWHAHFPGRILEVGYEQLVADQYGLTRRMLDHCALPWDERCMHFHTISQAVATPSAQQVRNPLNAGSIGKWRTQESRLTQVRDLFTKHGITTM